MGRAGIAITYITNRDLEPLKRLLKQNHIEPVWVGDAPDLHRLPKHGGKKSGRPGGGRYRPGRGKITRRKPAPKRSR
jgi:hypothetical protein